MSDTPFVPLHDGPCYAVIFSSQLRPHATLHPHEPGDNGYGATADQMVEMASQQSGYLGVESVRDANGFGITVSYWRSEADIAAWKAVAEHAGARERGRADWYSRYITRVAKIERAYSWSKP